MTVVWREALSLQRKDSGCGSAFRRMERLQDAEQRNKGNIGITPMLTAKAMREGGFLS